MMFVQEVEKQEVKQYKTLASAVTAGIRKILKRMTLDVRMDLTQEGLMRLIERGETDTTSAYKAGMTVAGRWLREKVRIEDPISQIVSKNEDGELPDDPWQDINNLKAKDYYDDEPEVFSDVMRELKKQHPLDYQFIIEYIKEKNRGVKHTRAEYNRADVLKRRIRRLCLKQMS